MMHIGYQEGQLLTGSLLLLPAFCISCWHAQPSRQALAHASTRPKALGAAGPQPSPFSFDCNACSHRPAYTRTIRLFRTT